MDKLYIIAGPTASGKTATSIEVAKLLNGEIICADSMQIYKHMDIGTAKVKTFEMQDIPHHLYDIVMPNQPFTVAEFVNMAKSKISEIISKGKTPIMVGGTGLYIESLIYDYRLGESISDANIRHKLLQELKERGADYMHTKLKEIDPIDAEKIHKNNTKRMIRALEIYEITGKTKTANSETVKKPIYDVDMNILTFPRDVLYTRINKRVENMFEEGLIEEVKQLYNAGYTFDLQSMQAIGYKEFEPYIFKDLNNAQIINSIKDTIAKNSRHYAKRQITWFKRYDFADWLTNEECVNKYKNLIKNNYTIQENK